MMSWTNFMDLPWRNIFDFSTFDSPLNGALITDMKSSRLKRQAGRLKSGHQGGLSRQKFKCHVKSCEKELRSDKLREHYRTQVLWDDEGGPICPDSVSYRNANFQKQAHTKHFFDNGYSNINMPACQVPVNVPIFSFSATAAKRSREDIDKQADTQFETEIIDSSILDSEIETGTEPTTESTTGPRNVIACSSTFDSYNSLLLADNLASKNSLMMESSAEQQVDTNSNLTSTNFDLSEDSIHMLAERIGAILLEKKEMKGKAEESNFQKLLSLLTDNDKEYICMPCAQYSHSNKVPEKFKKMSVGNFGSFKKLTNLAPISFPIS